ncbi:MAG TPA: hypothetical protein VFF79_12510 [Conexibacter sp.]|nr:hypothetical protein [Conexibacter sp.]
MSGVAPETAEAPAATRDELDALADEVLAIAGAPIDAWAVAATLESRGVRDLDAAGRYGAADVFALAERVLVRCRERERPAAQAAAPDRSLRPRARRFAGHLARGAFFFVPLGLQIAALIVLGYSQWASAHFTLTQASVVALAAGASFVATAGCVQALGYLGPLFHEPGKDLLTERLTWSTVALGALLALAVGGALVAADALAGWPYSHHLVRVGITYYALLTALWLASGVLYMLRAYAGIAVATVVGIAFVALLHAGVGLGIYTAQWIALGISIAWAAVVLRRRARRTRGDLRLAKLGPRRLLVRAATPFLWYGTLYFALILCDRLVAWTAGSHPLPVWFDVRYELGLDLALIAVVPGLAFLEHTVEAFSGWVAPAQKRRSAAAIALYNRDALRFYRRQLVAALAFALAGVAAACLGVVALDALDALGELGRHVHAGVSPQVFAWGAAGYVLLTWGLLNATFLLSLARPWLVVAALVAAVLVDASVGIALSRSGSYWEAVIGLTAGGATFALLTAAIAVRTLHRSDYHYLAAY